MTVTFDFCSDLHVDQWYHTTKLIHPDGPKSRTADGRFLHIDWQWYKTASATVLVIAGDLANSLLDTVETIKDAAQVYDHVVFVEGNHDHYQEGGYRGDVDATHVFLKDCLRTTTNVTFLDGKSSLQIGDTLFVGALGWYDWKAYEHRGILANRAKDAWRAGNNDSRYVDYGVYRDPSILAFNQADMLRTQIVNAQDDDSVKNIVVVTHTIPSEKLTAWLEGYHSWNEMTPSYVNTQMENVIDVDENHKIKHWVYGHTHRRQIDEYRGIIFSNNARGYPRENDVWHMNHHTID